jgi:putative ABC transport system ATP-binding protein
LETSVFKYILRYSKRQQIILLMMTLASQPFIFLSLELPKRIINDAISGDDSTFPKDLFGFAYEQIPYLMVLCGIFLALVFFNGGTKFYINVYRGIVGERMLRRLRYQLVERVLRFPIPQFQKLSQGEIVSMVTTETEPLGGFIGDSFSLPTFQGGTLITVLFFIFVQDPVIGVAAIALYPIQGYIIPKIQRKVNLLGKERVKAVRKLSERLGETVTGAHEIHAHNAIQYELADYSHRLGGIFDIRRRIFLLKFFMKFINNFLAQLTPFFFFSVGGYQVIQGNLTFGSLVAVLGAYKDLQPMWKELLNYYQRMADARIKYDQLREQFMPAGMLEPDLIAPQEEPPDPITGAVVASNLSFEEDEGTKVIDGAAFSFNVDEHVAVVGGSGKSELARLLARQLNPTAGQVTIGGQRLSEMPESITGRRLAYIDQEAYIRSGSIRDAMLYGLKYYPLRPAEYEGEEKSAFDKRHHESVISGNSSFDIDSDWVDYSSIGVSDEHQLIAAMMRTLKAVGLETDVFQFGLRRVIDPAKSPDLANRILEARAAVHARLRDAELADLVEVFDAKKFTANASIAENILFGTPVGDHLNIETLGSIPYVRETLERIGLEQEFIEIGREMAALMVEIFQDLPPGHEFFERFGFFESDDLPEYQRMVNQASNKGLGSLNEEDQARLQDLTFKIVPARHHVDFFDDKMQARVLEARAAFAEFLPEDLAHSVEFFDSDRYNAASSIQDNMLFGKTADTKVQSASRIADLLVEVIDQLDLRAVILDVGLDFDVGIAGKRLSGPQRQKIAIARGLLKQPQLMIVNEAAAVFDGATQVAIFEAVKRELDGRGLVWVADDVHDENAFDRILNVDHGRVREHSEQEAADAPIVEADTTEDKADFIDLGERGGTSLVLEADMLAKIPFFADMDRSKLKLLAFTSKRQVFEKDQVMIQQGDSGDTAYMVVDGSFDVIVDTAQGAETIATRGQGELVGELALLCDAPRTATIKAREHMVVLTIAKEVFLKLVLENTEISANVTRMIASRLEGTLRSLTDLTAYYDGMTGLPNRHLFLDRVNQAISQGKRDGQTASSLIVVGLRNLEKVTKKLDSGEREKVFSDAAQRVKSCLREVDTLARINNSGLGIIAANAADAAEIKATVLDRIEVALAKPFELGSQTIQLDGQLEFDVVQLDEENVGRVREMCLNIGVT